MLSKLRTNVKDSEGGSVCTQMEVFKTGFTETNGKNCFENGGWICNGEGDFKKGGWHLLPIMNLHQLIQHTVIFGQNE